MLELERLAVLAEDWLTIRRNDVLVVLSLVWRLYAADYVEVTRGASPLRVGRLLLDSAALVEKPQHVVPPRLSNRVTRHRELHRATDAFHDDIVAPLLFKRRKIHLKRLLAGERRAVLADGIGKASRERERNKDFLPALRVDDGIGFSNERREGQGPCRPEPSAYVRVLAHVRRVAHLVDLEDRRRHIGVISELACHSEVYAVALLHRRDLHEDVVYHLASRQVEVVAVGRHIMLHSVRLGPIRDDALYRLQFLRKRLANFFHDILVQGNALAPYLPVSTGALRLFKTGVRKERGVFIRRAVALDEQVLWRKCSNPKFRRVCGKRDSHGRQNGKRNSMHHHESPMLW